MTASSRQDTPSWAGGRVTPRAWCVLAPNPGPMTLDGTNTWVLAEPGRRTAVVVDPGPDLDAHHDAVLAVLERLDVEAIAILLTHGHPDHAEGARSLSERAGGPPVRALDPAHRLGDEGLAGGDRLDLGGLELAVVSTPGHTADSLSFHLIADHAVLTGDTVLGRGTSVVAHPEGRLDDYFASLQRLAALTETYGLEHVLPGHGPPLDDPDGVIAGYQAHRAERLEQVRAALAGGARSASDVVARVYVGVDPVLWPAAELSVQAQLRYLNAETEG
jgi:glyoxylase-like metal-dependent hydrolase (beta-lactamase superfamily II)